MYSASFTPSIKDDETAGISANGEETEDHPEGDLDTEIIRALVKRGNNHLQESQYTSAEQKLRICLKLLGTAPEQQQTQRLKVQRLLVEALMKQRKWSEARAELQHRLAQNHVQNSKEQAQTQALEDFELIIAVLRAEKNFAEAHLYGRRLLTGYRALGTSGYAGIRQSLDLLILICQEEPNADQEQAYSSMLAVFLEENSAPNSAIPTEAELCEQRKGLLHGHQSDILSSRIGEDVERLPVSATTSLLIPDICSTDIHALSPLEQLEATETIETTDEKPNHITTGPVTIGSNGFGELVQGLYTYTRNVISVQGLTQYKTSALRPRIWLR
jgi:hypothetical protein